MQETRKSRLASIKAQIDNKLLTLYQALNSVTVAAKEDRMCQTQSNGYGSTQMLHQMECPSMQEGPDQKATQISITSTQMQSHSNLSTSEVRESSFVTARLTESHTKSSMRGWSESLKHATTNAKRQRIKSKIDNGNQVFESILKQRKKSVPIKRLFSVKRDQLKTQTIIKVLAQVRSSYKKDRVQSDEGYIARCKLIQKIQNRSDVDT